MDIYIKQIKLTNKNNKKEYTLPLQFAYYMERAKIEDIQAAVKYFENNFSEMCSGVYKVTVNVYNFDVFPETGNHIQMLFEYNNMPIYNFDVISRLLCRYPTEADIKYRYEMNCNNVKCNISWKEDVRNGNED